MGVNWNQFCAATIRIPSFRCSPHRNRNISHHRRHCPLPISEIGAKQCSTPSHTEPTRNTAKRLNVFRNPILWLGYFTRQRLYPRNNAPEANGTGQIDSRHGKASQHIQPVEAHCISTSPVHHQVWIHVSCCESIPDPFPSLEMWVFPAEFLAEPSHKKVNNITHILRARQAHQAGHQ